jgi:hypothetical protein
MGRRVRLPGVECARPLIDATASVLIIGIGGLGHLGVQIVKATTAAQIIAVDVDATKVELAGRLGADTSLLSGATTAEEVRDANGGRSIDVVLNFAGSQASVDLAVDVVKRGGMIVAKGRRYEDGLDRAMLGQVLAGLLRDRMELPVLGQDCHGGVGRFEVEPVDQFVAVGPVQAEPFTGGVGERGHSQPLSELHEGRLEQRFDHVRTDDRVDPVR